MKRVFLWGCLFAAIFAESIWAAPKNYAEPERVRFLPKNGKWNESKNWSNKKAPKGFTRVYIPGGKEVAVRGKAEISDNVILGSAAGQPATLSILKAGKMTAGFISVLGTSAGAEGVVRLEGGELQVGNDKEGRGQLYVGAETSCSGKALSEFYSGKFIGGITVGSAVKRTQEGLLRIDGSETQISTLPKGRNFLRLNPSGVIEFVLDKKGVATMDYSLAKFLSEGGMIRVDGKAYEGGSRRINLIVAEKMVGELPQVEICNFSSRYQAEVLKEYTDNGAAEALVLKITELQKP